jgi:uncharacterized protein (TIGR02300 family)
VAKSELGVKRLCTHCGVKFYDLQKDPITCPKCHNVVVLAPVTSRSRPDAARAAAAAAAEAEAIVPETQEAEFVSLEEADAEAQGKKPADAAVAGDDDIEIDESLDDAAFIEETEEGDEDVTDIIGDVESEEEP